MPIIAIDADGVLLDYHAGYRAAWQRAFGVLPAVRDPHAYWALDRYAVRRLEAEERAQFRAAFDENHWATLPPIEGAMAACHQLVAAGYDLVCITAISPRYQAARLRNLQDLGFPISHVAATSNESAEGMSPKAAALRDLQPVAFVDDYLPYFRGIPPEIHAALVLRQPNGSPNAGDDLALLTHSRHSDLADFANWWLRVAPSPAPSPSPRGRGK